MSRGTFQIIIAAMIAGALGFGIAICAVPLEEIAQFRALVNAGLGAISMRLRRDNGDTRLEHSTAPPSNASTEPGAPTRGQRDTNSSCALQDANCISGPPTEPADPRDIPEHDRATQNAPGSESGAPQTPVPENEPAKSPSLAPHGKSERTQGVPAGQSKRPAKKPR